MNRLPVEVTAERLIGHYEKFWPIMSAAEKDAWFVVVNGLFDIADGEHWHLGHPGQPRRVWE